MLEVNERGKNFHKCLRDLVERMYRRSFHLQYKIQSNDSKNQILSKLQEEFPENWSMRHVKLLIAKTYSNKKVGMKKKYSFRCLSRIIYKYQFCYTYFSYINIKIKWFIVMLHFQEDYENLKR